MNADWLNHPSLKTMQPAKKQLLMELSKNVNLNNPTFESLLPILMSTNMKMKEQGLSFTKQENDLITEILMARVSPAERAKFDTIIKMMPSLMNRK